MDAEEAIGRGLLDLTRGVFIHPLTGETFSLQEALDRGFLHMDPDTHTDGMCLMGLILPTLYARLHHLLVV